MSAATMEFADGEAKITGRLMVHDPAAIITATGLSPIAGNTFRCVITDTTGLVAYAVEVDATRDETNLVATVDLTLQALIDVVENRNIVSVLVAWYDSVDSIMLGAGKVLVARAADSTEV